MEQKYLDFLQNTELGIITDSMLLAKAGGWVDGLYPANPETRLCGRAFTVQFSSVQSPDQPVCNFFQILDQCQPGDVIVVSAEENGAVVGENLVFHARNRGAVGWLIDGNIRDTNIIVRSGIPCFSRGPMARIPYNCKPTAVQVPVRIGNVVIHPGDYIVGDVDGAIAISPDVIDRVMYQSVLVQESEDGMDAVIRAGGSGDEVKAMSMKKKTPRP